MRAAAAGRISGSEHHDRQSADGRNRNPPSTVGSRIGEVSLPSVVLRIIEYCRRGAAGQHTIETPASAEHRESRQSSFRAANHSQLQCFSRAQALDKTCSRRGTSSHPDVVAAALQVGGWEVPHSGERGEILRLHMQGSEARSSDWVRATAIDHSRRTRGMQTGTSLVATVAPAPELDAAAPAPPKALVSGGEAVDEAAAVVVVSLPATAPPPGRAVTSMRFFSGSMYIRGRAGTAECVRARSMMKVLSWRRIVLRHNVVIQAE